MNHRERFHAAVRRQPVDRAVYDLCGCPQTLVDYPETREALGALLGATDADPHVFPLDERILEKLKIDTRMVGGMPTPATSHIREEGSLVFDNFGIGYREVNRHQEIACNPLRDATLDEVLAWEFPNPDNIDNKLLESWAREAERLHTQTDYAVVAQHPVLGVFELGCWMFGFDDYLYRCAADPEVVHAFSARVLDYQKHVLRKYYGALGAYIDCTSSGDDFGMQTGAFLSPGMFRELIKPYFQERIAFTKTLTSAFYQHHTCGSVYVLIPDLIDCGVDILNPIQPGVTDMEHGRLQREFGDRLAFWGGVDTQHLLPHGTREEIRAAVRNILSVFRSGYILSPAHTIQYDVPAENVLAIYEGAEEFYGSYM